MPETSYRLDEVKKHNKRDDAWIIVHGKVALSAHPIFQLEVNAKVFFRNIHWCENIRFTSAQVYNITPHINNHPGWECACGISTVLAIMRVLGTDCSDEFDEVHTTEGGKKQLLSYCIGRLEKGDNG